MGIITSIRSQLASLSRPDPLTPIRSPWASTSLTKIVLQDMAGVTDKSPGRAEAMKVSSIVKARSLICLLARHPLAVYDTATGEKDPEQPAWLTTTAGPQSPRLRNLWTFDDKLFGGLSLWATDRDSSGAITDSVRVPPALWTVDPGGRIQIGGKTISAEQVLLFEGPQEGLVTIAADTIAAALAMDKAWADRVKHPIPMQELHSTDESMNLDDDERDVMVTQWETARMAGGGTAYTPAGIDFKPHGETSADLFIQGRNALRLDIANFCALPAALLEGSMSTASLTYSTKEGSRNDFVDLSLDYWAMPFEARLSQDDVVPSGKHVAIDLSQLATAVQPTRSPNQED